MVAQLFSYIRVSKLKALAILATSLLLSLYPAGFQCSLFDMGDFARDICVSLYGLPFGAFFFTEVDDWRVIADLGLVNGYVSRSIIGLLGNIFVVYLLFLLFTYLHTLILKKHD